MYFKQFGSFHQHGALLIRIGRILDGLILFFSLYFLVYYYNLSWTRSYLAVVLLGILFFELTTSFFHLYRSWRFIPLSREIFEIFSYLSISLFFVTFVLYFFEIPGILNNIIFYWYVVSFLLICSYRCCVRILLRSFRTIGYDQRRVCFIGATCTAKHLSRSFQVRPWMGIDVLGIFDDRETNPDNLAITPDSELSGNIYDLLELARMGEVDSIYITLPMFAEKRIKELVDSFSDTTVSIFYCPNFSFIELLNTRWDNVHGHPVISIVDSPFTGITGFAKRVEDLLLASLMLPFIALPTAVIAIAIKLSSPGPVFYRQSRYGLDSKEFKIWKFRSMYTTESDAEFQQARKSDSRVTPVGHFLRRSSLDELPQLINVFNGTMSVIGPRPHPVKLNETHRKLIYRYMLRHKIKPGITGLAQVNGFRGETESLYKMEKRIEYDLEYMNNWSLWLDIKILFKTALTLLSDKNAY